MSRVVVSGLHVALSSSKADVVTDANFTIASGEIVGLVGESGSGKTTVATAMLGHTRKGAEIVQGSVTIDGVDILSLSAGALRSARGRVISYVPQDPAAALDPCMTIGRVVNVSGCALRWHLLASLLASFSMNQRLA